MCAVCSFIPECIVAIDRELNATGTYSILHTPLKHLFVGVCVHICVKLCVFRRCELIPMCLTHSEVCSETIGCDGDASSGVRGCVIGSLLQEFSPHMQMALKQTFTPIAPCSQNPSRRDSRVLTETPSAAHRRRAWKKRPVVKMIIFCELEQNRHDGMSGKVQAG